MFDFDSLDSVSGPPAFPVYLKACEAGGGAAGFPAAWRALLGEAVEAAGRDGEAAAPARSLLELVIQSAASSLPGPSAGLADCSGSPVLEAFLTLVQRAVGLPPLELEAVRRRKCTGELCPGVPRLQLNFFGVCVCCFLDRHADREACCEAEGQAGVYVPFLCSGQAFPPGICPAATAPAELKGRAREVAECSAGGLGGLESLPGGWPVPWRRLVAHLAALRALELRAEGRPPAALGAAQFAALRELHHPSPALKLRSLRSGDGKGPSRLVVLLHGGLQTSRHLEFMFRCTGLDKVIAPEARCLEVVGVEADFAYKSLAAGLSKPAEGFSYLRFEGCLARLGEYVMSTVRVLRQCLERHAERHPGCPGIDLVGFSAGGMVAWLLLLLCAAPALRVGALVLLSPRLEGMHDVWEESFVKETLAAHQVTVFLGYGQREDEEAQGKPFGALARKFGAWLPAGRFRSREYANVGHTMLPEELAEAGAFLAESWGRSPGP